jgi:hypothetical protein
MAKDNKDNYHIVDFPEIGKNFGNFTSDIPSRAASKGLTQMLKKVPVDNPDNNKFIIFTIENKDTCKRYKYIGIQVKLQNPINVRGNDNTSFHKYRNIISNYEDCDYSVGKLNFSKLLKL